MSAFSELKQRARAQAHDISDPSTTVTGKDVAERAVARRTYQIVIPKDADATTARNSLAYVGFPASEFPDGVEVKSITMRTAAVTTHADNHFTDTFTALTVAGAVGNSVATLTSDADNTIAQGGMKDGGAGATTAGIAVACLLTSTLADRVVAAGGCLRLQRAKAGAGVTLGECTYTVTVEAL